MSRYTQNSWFRYRLVMVIRVGLILVDYELTKILQGDYLSQICWCISVYIIMYHDTSWKFGLFFHRLYLINHDDGISWKITKNCFNNHQYISRSFVMYQDVPNTVERGIFLPTFYNPAWKGHFPPEVEGERTKNSVDVEGPIHCTIFMRV